MDSDKLFNLIKEHKWDEFEKEIKANNILDLNIRDAQNNYLLTYLIIFNKPKLVKLILESGANIDIIDNEGKSVLFIPIKFNYQDIIDILLEFNKDNIGISITDIRDKTNNIPLHYSIEYNNITSLHKLLKSGSGSNLYSMNSNGFNSLHSAVYTRSLKACELLIKFGIDVNARCKTGETALHIACNFELVNIVELLLANGANPNIQDWEHEFTPLHYAVGLNNRQIIKLLLDNKVDVNLQDIVANTVVHYAISDKNLEVLSMIMKKYPDINLNLWNYDGKTPLVLLLEVEPDNIWEYMELILPSSNVNIQDNNGNTGLHLICVREHWEEFSELIIKKKLDIFIKNKANVRPIDLIKKNKIDQFIDLVSSSYIYRLRNTPDAQWANSWENLCKTELGIKLLDEEVQIIKNSGASKSTINKFNKMIKGTESDKFDICKQIAKDKIIELVENPSTCSKSFPVKREYMCLKITEGQTWGMCTFTGTTLDILIGLIYLLKKHPKACSTFPKNFSGNKELCQFYQSTGIIVNSHCELLNFEVVWVNRKIYLGEHFYENFAKCLKNTNVQFIIVPIGIELKEGSHANYLLYDKSINEIERFEPHGFNIPVGFNYDPNLLDDILELRIKEIDSTIKYIRPKDYLPKVGFQQLDIYENNKKRIGDPGGFCALWTIWYIDMRISNIKFSRDVLVKNMIQTIKAQNISFKNLIRNYSKDILEIRDNILSKASMDINDWLNDNYTSDQYQIILDELARELGQIS